MFPPRSTRIFGHSPTVQPTFIADPYTLLVETSCVSTDTSDRAGRFDITVSADIKMIPRSVESATAVTRLQVMLGEALVLPGGGAVDDN